MRVSCIANTPTTSSDDPKALLEGIENFKPVELKKWVSEIKEQVK